MNVENTKSLVDLFFNKLKEIDSSRIFLQWLKPNYNHQYSWNEVSEKIHKLSNQIKQNLATQILIELIELLQVTGLIEFKYH